ncbi:MAG: hypothetical protein ACLQU3_15495 [Limisphaerales bacterium]
MKGKLCVLLIGGPDAGKSNFLFRVWLAIDTKTGVLSSDGIPNDLEYLKTGVEQLLGGEFAAKTSIEVQNQSIIPVKYSRGAEEVHGTLVVPDCPGEQWLGIYKRRDWSEEWDQLISEGCGCLVFVRADSDQIVAKYDWISYFKQFGTTVVPGNASKEVNTGTSGSTTSMAPQKSAETPTQVVLVDWLQFLKRAFAAKVGGNFRPRVGIVVAAWDRVPTDQQGNGPTQWLESNFPMLAHFLESNSNHYLFETFGISVVGGDLKNDPNFRREYRSGDPTKAGYVVIGSDASAQKHPDLTLPIAWALGLEKEFLLGVPPQR